MFAPSPQLSTFILPSLHTAALSCRLLCPSSTGEHSIVTLFFSLSFIGWFCALHLTSLVFFPEFRSSQEMNQGEKPAKDIHPPIALRYSHSRQKWAGLLASSSLLLRIILFSPSFHSCVPAPPPPNRIATNPSPYLPASPWSDSSLVSNFEIPSNIL